MRYQLVWPGKEKIIKKNFQRQSGCLIDGHREIYRGDFKNNLFIEGDNIDVLKILNRNLEDKIKFIYIDPPYNTGKNFAYRDNFPMNFSDKERPGEIDRSTRRHSGWLLMMYPLLTEAHRLLAPSGAIFISIDDSELANLILLCDEIFGEENRAGIITWVKKKKGSHLSKTLRKITEFILVYGKDASQLDLYGEDAYKYKWQPLVKRINSEKKLTFPAWLVETTLKKQFYPSGTYGNGGTAVKLLNDIHIREGRITNSFSIIARAVWTQEKLNRELELGTRVSIRSEKMGPSVFRHDQLSKKKCPPTLLDHRLGVGTNEDAWQELRTIFKAENVYSYPKPVSLIKYLAQTVSHYDRTGIFLDFFAGSGTTGQAVVELNREDGGDRKFILVQNKEKLNPPLNLPGGMVLNTISSLCRERLNRTIGPDTFKFIKYKPVS